MLTVYAEGGDPVKYDFITGEGDAHLVYSLGHWQVAVAVGPEAQQWRTEKAAAVLASRTAAEERTKVGFAVERRRHAVSPRLAASVPPGSPPTPTP